MQANLRSRIACHLNTMNIIPQIMRSSLFMHAKISKANMMKNQEFKILLSDIYYF